MYGISALRVGDSDLVGAEPGHDSTTAPVKGVEITWSGPGRGKTVVATSTVPQGTALWREKPLAAIQSLPSRAEGTMVCRHTLRFLGTMGASTPTANKPLRPDSGTLLRVVFRLQAHSYRSPAGIVSGKKKKGKPALIRS